MQHFIRNRLTKTYPIVSVFYLSLQHDNFKTINTLD